MQPSHPFIIEFNKANQLNLLPQKRAKRSPRVFKVQTPNFEHENKTSWGSNALSQTSARLLQKCKGKNEGKPEGRNSFYVWEKFDGDNESQKMCGKS